MRAANPTLLTALAQSIIAGEPHPNAIELRLAATLGRPWRWLRPLSRRYAKRFSGQTQSQTQTQNPNQTQIQTHTRPRLRDVIRFLQTDPGFVRARARYGDQIRIAHWIAEPQQMLPVPAAQTWNLPALASVSELALWLGVSLTDLDWFADLKGLTRHHISSPLAHYNPRILPKKSGGLRLIEAPKSRLRALQRQVLREILDHIPPHPAAHGFVPGRSVKTFATPHVGQAVLLRIDLQNFFPSIRARRVQTIFRTLGYPEPVADRLGGLCTNVVPRRLWRATSGISPETLRDATRIYSRPHLPQGAPTSPALANLCAFRADCRLDGLARSAGAAYSRYADDLAFSGPDTFRRSVQRFQLRAVAILLEEGFDVNFQKTRVMHQSSRQSLAGLVVNRRLNYPRRDFDQLKAILTNCAQHGPETQNRAEHTSFQEHLAGRVAYVESINPEKGARLRGIFDQISWT